LPHPGLGEEVAAAVVLRSGANTTPEEIRPFVKERVAPYKYPGWSGSREGASQIGYRQDPEESHFYRTPGVIQVMAKGRLFVEEKTVK
jgi:hypothetical protein